MYLKGLMATGVAVGLFAVGLPAKATAAPPPRMDDRSTYTFVIDNDAFIGQDNNYTNGFRLVYTPPRGEAAGWKKALAKRLPLFPEGADVEYTGGWAIGQHIYTSRDIEDVNPPLDQHPYSGWLYGETSIIADNFRRFDALRVSLGVVGPVSLGQQVQLTIHDFYDIQEPEGWDTQLPNEPTINVGYECRWRLLRGKVFVDDVEVEVMPTVGFNAGTVFTDLNTGVIARFGFNMPYDYGPPRVKTGVSGSPGFDTDRFGFYFFGGVEGQAIGRDMSLDGTLFRDSRAVEKENFVGNVQFGAALVWPRVRLTATQVYLTDRFETEDEEDGYTSLAFSVKF